MTSYAVAARRAQVRTGRPLPPWHAVEISDGAPADRAGERVTSLCGVPGLRVFPLSWEGLVAANGCPVCRTRSGPS